ncbi:MAG: UDP-N-acetylmuramate--L-alanine ligase [Clostridia bacterium]|nr:UDP-N-acetylmuramate--L-alanine ligase [Clostridia bacterium]
MSTPNTHYSCEQLDVMLHDARAIYFLGIGGISVSSLASLSAQQGFRVGGYDRTVTPLVRRLMDAGIPVDTLACAENIDGYDAVVYTVAISDEQPEYIEAKKRGLPLISRSNYMGYLMRAYRHRIGIAGTHGKSSTTGMCAEIFAAAQRAPTVLCGAEMPGLGGAYCVGAQDTLIFEACEYMDSFLDFYPTTAVVLNTELDHVDYFESLARMCRSYTAFGDKVGESGTVIYNADDAACTDAMQSCAGRRVSFGIEADADYRAADVRVENGRQSFSLYIRGKHVGRISMCVHGRHNVYNALAAAAAAAEQGVCTRAIAAGLEGFCGVHRRMEFKATLNGAAVYDDYAHHPTEIRAALDAARVMSDGRVVCAFQSHTFSRTAALFDQFVDALQLADAVIIAPIYAAREQNTFGVSEKALAQALCSRGVLADCGMDFEDTAKKLRALLSPGDVALVMGAGDVEKVYPYLFS